MIDVNTKRMLASYLLNNFEEGVYLSFGVSGNVQFRITRFFYDHYGNPDYPVCSAIFSIKNECYEIGLCLFVSLVGFNLLFAREK